MSLAGAGALAACGRLPAVDAASQSRPSVQTPVITLRFMPWWTEWSGTGLALLKQGCAQFEAIHTGLRLQPLPGPNGTLVTSAAVLSAMLAGQGPDVVCDYGDSFGAYVASGAFVDLQPLLTAQDIPLSTWSQAHIEALRTPSGQFGLPTYDGPCVYAYRQDLLAELGLDPPDSNWTYTEAADLWRRCALPAAAGSGQVRYGATTWWWDGWKASNWLFTAFGGAEMDAAATSATLSDPSSLRAGEWLLPLLWYGVVGTYTAATLQQGTTVFALRGGWSIQDDVLAFGNNFPWDYAPVPVYQYGRATFGNNDFWGLNALSPNQAAAWELMKWLTYEDQWQRFCIRTALLQPCKNSLWDEWEVSIRAAAPVLRDKALQWYRDAAQGGYGYAQQFFRYQPSAADAVLSSGMPALNAGPADISKAFTGMDQSIDALQTAGAALQGRLADAVRRFVVPGTASGGEVLLNPPAVDGLGAAPGSASSLVTSGPTGTYRVTGRGPAVGGLADAGTFAGLAANASVAEYACRVTELANVSCPSLPPQALAGLIARGDLSDDAPMVLVAVSASAGVSVLYRTMAGFASAVPASAASPLAPPSSAGAARPRVALPLWLRLRRQADLWTAWTAPDGTHWTQVGASMPVLMSGAWVGLFVSAGNASLAGAAGGAVLGAFDRASFVPLGYYRLGAV